MSGLAYGSYDGFGKEAETRYHHSQTVRIGDRIEASGQGAQSMYRVSACLAAHLCGQEVEILEPR
jgi:hypothetical protein